MFPSEDAAKGNGAARSDLFRFGFLFRAGDGHCWPAPDGEGPGISNDWLGGDEESSAFAVDEEQGIASRFADGALELRDGRNRLMVYLLNDVAFLEAGVGHFAGGVDVGDNDALGRFGNAEFAGGA
jgi:hypothetical protein